MPPKKTNKDANDNKKSTAANQDQASNQVDNQASDVKLNVHTQFIKDLSFENPNAPQSLISGNKPKINLGINVEANALNDNNFEVAIKIKAEALNEDKNVFLLELEYAGLIELHCADASLKQQILMIHCPNLLFPFARAVVANTTRDAGFPPLMMSPVDFSALYANQMQQQAQSN
ncbi:MAG: protein-export chaperone SecB [Pseudomonadota bacterium]